MNLSAAYQEARQKAVQQGVLQGVQQGVQQGIQQGIQQGVQQGVQQGIQQGVQQGIQQGVQQGRLGLVESLLKSRFGKIDKRLSTVIEPLVQSSPQEVADWLLHLSREELIAKFGKARKVK